MTDQLKTVDEIMDLIHEYGDRVLQGKPRRQNFADMKLIITGLHTAAGEASALRPRVAELETALMPFAEVGCFNDCQHDYDVARKAMGLDG